MKMFAAVASPRVGTVSKICVKIGESVESVESKDIGEAGEVISKLKL